MEFAIIVDQLPGGAMGGRGIRFKRVGLKSNVRENRICELEQNAINLIEFKTQLRGGRPCEEKSNSCFC